MLRRLSASPSSSSALPRLLVAPLWVPWAILALALVADPIRETIGLGEYAYCDPDPVRYAQLAPLAAGPVVLAGFRRTPVALLAFLLLVLGWFLLVVAGGCAFGSDD